MMKIMTRKTRKPDRRFGRHIKILGLGFAIASLLASVWAFAVEPGLLTITRLTISDPDLPDSWDGRVIALVSDAHVGVFFDEARFGRVADAVSEAQPDLVLFAGDLIDHRTPDDEDFIAAISASLARMQGKFGQFAVRGNHDNRLAAELKQAEKMFDDGGFTLLVNESVVINGLWLGGMDEKYFGRPDLQATFPESAGTQDLWRVLLMHQPDYAAALPADSADLILSGHTHNGQVAIFDRPLQTVHLGRWYTYGHYDLADGRNIIVTRGLGTVVLPARFGAPPEVMLITLARN